MSFVYILAAYFSDHVEERRQLERYELCEISKGVGKRRPSKELPARLGSYRSPDSRVLSTDPRVEKEMQGRLGGYRPECQDSPIDRGAIEGFIRCPNVDDRLESSGSYLRRCDDDSRGRDEVHAGSLGCESRRDAFRGVDSREDESRGGDSRGNDGEDSDETVDIETCTPEDGMEMFGGEGVLRKVRNLYPYFLFIIVGMIAILVVTLLSLNLVQTAGLFSLSGLL